MTKKECEKWIKSHWKELTGEEYVERQLTPEERKIEKQLEHRILNDIYYAVAVDKRITRM